MERTLALARALDGEKDRIYMKLDELVEKLREDHALTLKNTQLKNLVDAAMSSLRCTNVAQFVIHQAERSKKDNDEFSGWSRTVHGRRLCEIIEEFAKRESVERARALLYEDESVPPELSKKERKAREERETEIALELIKAYTTTFATLYRYKKPNGERENV